MGMYSSWEWEDLKLANCKLKDLEKFALEKAKGKSVTKCYWEDFLKGNSGKKSKEYKLNKNISFRCFNDDKIQGYWYPAWNMFLMEIADLFEGEVHFRYEEGHPFYINFEDGFVRIHMVPVQWEEITPQQLLEMTTDMVEIGINSMDNKLPTEEMDTFIKNMKAKFVLDKL